MSSALGRWFAVDMGLRDGLRGSEKVFDFWY